MKDRLGSRRTRFAGLGVIALVALAVVASAVASSSSSSRATACGNVTLNENAWAGSTSNVYVVKYVLEKRLGCKVKVSDITEGQPNFQAMADGKIDAVLEDWQNLASFPQYVKTGKLKNLGGNGITGVIGWYIPRYLLKQYPQFATWKGLKGKEDVFKSPESGSQGMFLGGDPSYAQKDKMLIQGLGLNLKHVVAGAEPAQVARWSQLYKQKKPVIFYWYDPQYLNQQYDLAEVKLPPRTDANKDCKDDAKAGGDPNQYKCAYDVTIINKLFSKKFADSGSPAYDMLKKFKLTNDDQEKVAKAIAGDHQDPDQAGADWVKDNPDKVNAWLQ